MPCLPSSPFYHSSFFFLSQPFHLSLLPSTQTVFLGLHIFLPSWSASFFLWILPMSLGFLYWGEERERLVWAASRGREGKRKRQQRLHVVLKDRSSGHTWLHVSSMISVRLWASHFNIQSLSILIWNMGVEEKWVEHGVWDPHRERPFLSLHLKGHPTVLYGGCGEGAWESVRTEEQLLKLMHSFRCGSLPCRSFPLAA